MNLKDADIAILSHGHYDHGGGLEKFLEINTNAPVYLSRYAFGDYYNGQEKYIGLDKKLKDNKRLIFTEDELQIDDNLFLYSCNKSEKKYDSGSSGLTELKNNSFIPDRFLHEQYLLIKENSRTFLISGCSHKGILDITEWFSPDVLVGGFHFSKFPLDEKLKEYAEILQKSGTTFYTCHCTGTEQYEFMKKYIKNLHYLPCGKTIQE
ncbi:MAG: MBL fold metallo-hydrolase [Clostridia bacterium]|nr:MBL fold metallo-hydrolase [Clostridia bacterium]